MKYSIAFKNLPFEPDEEQVIYVENHFDERINAIIKEKYEWIKWTFSKADLDFIYLPKFFEDEDIEEKVRYYAPYLTHEVLENVELRSNYLLGFMSHRENISKIPPSLLYRPQKEGDEWIFQGLSFENIDEAGHDIDISWFETLISEIEETDFLMDNVSGEYHAIEDEAEVNEGYSDWVEYSSTPQFNEMMLAAEEGVQDNEALGLDDIREESVEEEIEAFQRYAKRLRLKGISLAVLHELVDKGEMLSRIRITDDLRIFLPDYDNLEVKLGPQYKAIYLLFLTNPKGIVLQKLGEYHNELTNYYCQTNKCRKPTAKMIGTIKSLEDYGNKSLNPILSKIKKVFFNSFDEHLARHYIITGNPGEPYRIPLDVNLIEWEDDYEWRDYE